MAKNFNLKVIYAVAMLSGTIIGVGLFALPYTTLKIGFWVMLGYFLVLGSLVILIHQIFGELALKTPDLKRLPGFARYHLGKWGEKIAIVSSIFGTFGAILAYLIVGGEFLENLLSPFFGGGNLIYTLIYFLFGAFLIFFGIKAIAKVEFWGLIGFFLILILIFFRAKGFINTENLFLNFSDFGFRISDLFLPYGAVLFSLWGAALIPEIEEMLYANSSPSSSFRSDFGNVHPPPKIWWGASGHMRIFKNKEKNFKKIITISILIPIFVYLFFIYLILGISGPQTTESALTGLKNVLGDGIVSLALFFGVLTTFTSFIALGLTLKKVFWYDLKIEKNLSWVITCFIPLILFLIGVKQFIPVISFVGGVMLGIDGILILLMYSAFIKTSADKQKISRKRLLVYPLILVLLGGIIYEIIYFVR